MECSKLHRVVQKSAKFLKYISSNNDQASS